MVLFAGISIKSSVPVGLRGKHKSASARQAPVTMRVDGLKFLDTSQILKDTSQILNTAQSLVFGKDEGAQQDPAISKEITLPDAEDVDKQVEISRDGGCPVPPFVPYTATVPWHSGTRNLFSRFFPRYGNYCGPNYSSGRESGSLYWDKAPTDWLDYCCYRHDMGYDTLDQAKLHKADKEFLRCLQTIPESAKISTVGVTYRTLYILGLERFLLPYRDILVKKIEEGKRGRETAPEVIVEEVKERNVDMNTSS
ncbi:hypothetical protein M758_7G083800 [Ceratodon purpureus]|uniref:Phospholipase A2 family protein n=1 Tax=Ceratodon purpureus TaxID=3225 RepID=A0A8T0H4G2_CERPU|nr:hypothetical protein KC19_7G089000 [Ceratodon purpureus]KAG0610684.1 hypothetical protein M758_7G083800 [Ceratodon purpureus]